MNLFCRFDSRKNESSSTHAQKGIQYTSNHTMYVYINLRVSVMYYIQGQTVCEQD